MKNQFNFIYIENNHIIFFSKKGIFKFRSTSLCYFFFYNFNYFILNSNLIFNLYKKHIMKYINLIKSLFNNITNAINFGYTDYLFFRGIGYKIYNWFNFIFLKLGYSHYFYYIIPLEIAITLKKKKKIIKFYLLQNWYFSYVISKMNKFRLYNLYTKKGIFKKLQYLFFKEGKKKQL